MRARARRPWLDRFSRTLGRVTGPRVARLVVADDVSREENVAGVKAALEAERPPVLDPNVKRRLLES